MNSYLYPFLVLLIVTLGLCIPKRLFGQNAIMKFSFLALAVTVIIAMFRDIRAGLVFLLAVMSAAQAVVLLLTIHKNRSVRFEKEGIVAQTGSSLLHLGTVVLILNFAAFGENVFHIWIFWAGTMLLTAGNFLSFYPCRINSLLRGKTK